MRVSNLSLIVTTVPPGEMAVRETLRLVDYDALDEAAVSRARDWIVD